jgi:hypothetical protein
MVDCKPAAQRGNGFGRAPPRAIPTLVEKLA